MGGAHPNSCTSEFGCAPPNHLELQTQSALNHTRPAPNKSGIGTNGSRGGGSHSRRDFAKVPAALVVLRIRKIRVVEQIEKLGSKLKTDLFAELKILRGREIVILQPWTVILIATRGSDAPSWRGPGKVRGIERGIDIPVVLLNPPSTNHIGAVVELIEPAEVL